MSFVDVHISKNLFVSTSFLFFYLTACKDGLSTADTNLKEAQMKLKNAQSELKKKQTELKKTEKEYEKDKSNLENIEKNKTKLEVRNRAIILSLKENTTLLRHNPCGIEKCI